MKKKQGGKGRAMPTDHVNTDPKEALKKLIRKSTVRALQSFKQQAEK